VPSNLWARTEEELLEELHDRNSKELRLAEIQRELDLYRHPSWKIMEEKLKSVERISFEGMLQAQANIPELRERIRFARNLLQTPYQLEEQAAALERDLIEKEVSE